MESQDNEKEYRRKILESFGKEWATADREKRLELNKRMNRWQELMKSGVSASQAYIQVMGEESDESPIYIAIEEDSDYRMMEEPSDKQLAIPSPPRVRKAPLIFLSLALVAAIVYCVVITGDRNALNTELASVQSILVSTQAEFNSTKQTLATTQVELNSLNDTLVSMQAEIGSLNDTLVSTKVELDSTKQTLTSTQVELNSLNNTLASTQAELSFTKNTLISVQDELKAVEDKLKLYEETLGVTVFSEGSSLSRQMSLIDNPIATNPTWQELKAFLLADPTDDKTYITNLFDCDAFAVMLHNNAEAKGIKTAFVGLYFQDSDIGHALNAFKTADKGLVYVDCTGGPLSIRRTSQEWDKIAYVVKGKEYGSISLGKNTPIDYDSYEKMKADYNSYVQKLEAYSSEVQRFNREIFGKVYYIGTTEWYRIKEWERTLEEQARVLDNLLAQLEYVWEEMGIVESIEIYW